MAKMIIVDDDGTVTEHDEFVAVWDNPGKGTHDTMVNCNGKLMLNGVITLLRCLKDSASGLQFMMLMLKINDLILGEPKNDEGEIN